jgi:hypothetical protein
VKRPQLVAALALAGAAGVSAIWWGWQPSEPPAREVAATAPTGMSEGGIQRRRVLPEGGAIGVAAFGSAPAPAGALRSGGAMPQPAADPGLARIPGRTPSGVQMEQQMQYVRRMRRPAGIGPAAFGAQPTN